MTSNIRKLLNYEDLLKINLDKLLVLTNCNIKLRPIIINKKKIQELFHFINQLNEVINFYDINIYSSLILSFLDDYIINIFRLIPNMISTSYYYYQKIRTKRLNNWINNLTIGQKCDVKDSNNNQFYQPKWYEGYIIDIRDNSVKITYNGWKKRFDEWIPKNITRLLPSNTKLRNWRKNIKIDSIVEVKNINPNEYSDTTTFWHKAKVIEIDNFNRVKVKFIKCNKCIIHHNNQEPEKLYYLDLYDSNISNNNTHRFLNKDYYTDLYMNQYSSVSNIPQNISSL